MKSNENLKIALAIITGIATIITAVINADNTNDLKQ